MIWSLQILRFVAALMVVYLHAVQSAMRIIGPGIIPYKFGILGSAGVDIFFVISGVIMATVAPGKTAAEFARARVLRIIPVYFLCSIPAIPIAAARYGLGWRKMLATVFLWPATDQMVAPALGAAWSLCFEMIFYAAVTLVLVDRRWLYALLAIFAASFALRWVGPIFQFLGNPIILEFLAGAMIARLGTFRFGIAMLPLGVVALLIAAWAEVVPSGTDELFLAGEQAIQRVTVLGIPAVLIAYGTMHIRPQGSVWTYLGGASYSLYLVHPILIAGMSVIWIMFPTSPDLIIVTEIVVSLVVSWRVYELIERPVIARLKRAVPSFA